ncbi:MAG: type IV pilus modification protein PilV, partial [Halomonas sp.]
VAAMQLKALQSATQGYQRSVVTLAAVDAQERLWAQLGAIEQGISSKSDCSEVLAADIEDDWDTHWFGENSETPIRHFSGDVLDNGDDSSLSTCEFRIEINLEQLPGDTENDVFTYTFRLPVL